MPDPHRHSLQLQDVHPFDVSAKNRWCLTLFAHVDAEAGAFIEEYDDPDDADTTLENLRSQIMEAVSMSNAALLSEPSAKCPARQVPGVSILCVA